MNPVTPLQWKVYELTHLDHQGKSLEEAAQEMGVTEAVVQRMLATMKHDYPDLFTDISSDKRRPAHKTVRYGAWCEGDVKERF